MRVIAPAGAFSPDSSGGGWTISSSAPSIASGARKLRRPVNPSRGRSSSRGTPPGAQGHGGATRRRVALLDDGQAQRLAVEAQRRRQIAHGYADVVDVRDHLIFGGTGFSLSLGGIVAPALLTGGGAA